MKNNAWYPLHHPEKIDSPALLVYKKRVAENIGLMIRIAGNPARLVPHVKTHKMKEIVGMQLQQGIKKFKCATIAEAEMLAGCKVQEIILAYQLNEPKADRFLALIKKYPHTRFSSLIDNMDSAKLLVVHFAKENITANVFIDIDDGMHRTGINAEDAWQLYQNIQNIPQINFIGLHVYDGHIHDSDFEIRKQKCETAFAAVNDLAKKIMQVTKTETMIMAGGTPTFTIHAQHQNIFCSPGTCILWDEGYGSSLKEQNFLPAAILLTRIISKPAPGRITTDLGHKAVAAENAIDKRISFLNLADYKIISQSEEHLVVQVNDWKNMKIGDVLYGVPYHVCPTVALYDEAQIIEDGEQTDTWKIIARKRKITI